MSFSRRTASVAAALALGFSAVTTVAAVTAYPVGNGIQAEAGDGAGWDTPAPSGSGDGAGWDSVLADGAGWDTPAPSGSGDGAGWDAPVASGGDGGAGWDTPTPTGLA